MEAEFFLLLLMFNWTTSSEKSTLAEIKKDICCLPEKKQQNYIDCAGDAMSTHQWSQLQDFYACMKWELIIDKILETLCDLPESNVPNKTQTCISKYYPDNLKSAIFTKSCYDDVLCSPDDDEDDDEDN